MKSFEERTKIIRKLIKARMQTNPLPEADIPEYMLDSLPPMSAWGTPEGTIFATIIAYYETKTPQKTEIETINEIDSIDFHGKLPNKLNEYIKLKIDIEHSMFKRAYPISFIDMCILIVSTEMGYSLSNNISLTGKEAEYVSQHNQTVKAKNAGCIALMWIIGIGAAILLLTKC